MAVRSIKNYNYNYGSEAPDLWYDYEYERPARRQKENERRRKAVKRTAARRSSSLSAVKIISVIMVVMAMTVVYRYISLQTKVTAGVKDIASIESELATLKANNDEQLKEIESAVSLDDVKYRAITELGMTYAEKDQIVNYTNDTDDYVHQVSEAGK